MARHEWWRHRYNLDPYLDTLSNEQLRTRTADVVDNFTTINSDLKISPLPINRSGEFWMISWTHVLEEWATRGGMVYDEPFIRTPDLNWPGLALAVEKFSKLRRQSDGLLVKFGKTEHIRVAFDRGSFRISPASLYNDPSLNPAVRDDELSLDVYERSKLYAEVLDKHGGVLKPPGFVHGIRRKTFRSKTNYYVFCLAMEQSLRLFPDFEAKSALVIHSPRRFIRLLCTRVLDELGEGWSWRAGPISYIDPLRPPKEDLDILQSKHFRYTYQKEFRALWLPPKPLNKLEPFFIELGPLNKYADIVEI